MRFNVKLIIDSNSERKTVEPENQISPATPIYVFVAAAAVNSRGLFFQSGQRAGEKKREGWEAFCPDEGRGQ